MPKITLHDQSIGISDVPASPEQDQNITPKIADTSAVGEALYKTGAIATDFATTLLKSKVLADTAAAKSEFASAMTEHIAEGKRLTDFNEIEKHKEASDEIRQGITAKYPLAANLQPYMNHGVRLANVELDNHGVALVVDDIKAKGLAWMEEETNNLAYAIASGDKDAADDARTRRDDAADNIADVGAAHRSVTETWKLESDRKAELYAIHKLALTRPVDAGKMLSETSEDGSYANFTHLTATERVQAEAYLKPIIAHKVGTDIGTRVVLENPNLGAIDTIQRIYGMGLDEDTQRVAVAVAKETMHLKQYDKKQSEENAKDEVNRTLAPILLKRGFLMQSDLSPALMDRLSRDNPDYYMNLSNHIAQMAGKQGDAIIKQQQAIRASELIQDPAKLAAANIDDEFVLGKIGSDGHRVLQELKKNPIRGPEAKTAMKILEDLRTGKMFDSSDKLKNEAHYADYSQIVQAYIINHPDKDPVEFVKEKIMKPVQAGWVANVIDTLVPGTPNLDRAVVAQKEALRKEAGEMPKPNFGAPKNPTTPADIQNSLNTHSAAYGQRPTLMTALAFTESGFNPNAISPKGAGGVMQLMPEAAAGLKVANMKNNDENIKGGVKYFAQLNKQFGDEDKAIAAYNAGPGKPGGSAGLIPAMEKAQAKGGNWMDYVPEETRNHVYRVNAAEQLINAGKKLTKQNVDEVVKRMQAAR